MNFEIHLYSSVVNSYLRECFFGGLCKPMQSMRTVKKIRLDLEIGVLQAPGADLRFEEEAFFRGNLSNAPVDGLKLFLNGETNHSIEVGVGTHQIETNNPIDDFCLVRWCFGPVLGCGSNGDYNDGQSLQLVSRYWPRS